MFHINRINTTEDNQAMSRDKLEKASECFGCLVSEEHYMLIHPLQDKCYVVTKSIDRLVHLILCSSCMKDKVEELNVCNGINKKNYDVSGHSMHSYNYVVRLKSAFVTDAEECHNLDSRDYP